MCTNLRKDQRNGRCRGLSKSRSVRRHCRDLAKQKRPQKLGYMMVNQKPKLHTCCKSYSCCRQRKRESGRSQLTIAGVDGLDDKRKTRKLNRRLGAELK